MKEKMRRSESGRKTDAASSSSSPSTSSSSPSSDSSSDFASNDTARKRGGSLKRKRSRSRNRESEYSTTSSSVSSESSDTDVKRRKSKSSRGKERRSSRKRSARYKEKEKKREKRTRSKGTDEKHGRKEKSRREKRDRESSRKRKTADTDPVVDVKDDVPVQTLSKSNLQAMNDAQLQQKEIVRRNIERAKARLASGELDRMKHEQMEMQRLYGTVDWRQKKKLRAEKSRLERTVAAGQKLASIEERESARMDAFRVALGLPTAEAQRQAEWRAEATRALAAETAQKDNVSPPVSRVPSRSRKVIGPRLPH